MTHSGKNRLYCSCKMKLNTYFHNFNLCKKQICDAGIKGSTGSRLMDERDLESDFVT